MGYPCHTKHFRKTRRDIRLYVAVKRQLACIPYSAKDAHAPGMVVVIEQRPQPGFGSKCAGDLNTEEAPPKKTARGARPLRHPPNAAAHLLPPQVTF